MNDQKSNTNPIVKALSIACIVLSVILVGLMAVIIANTEKTQDPFVSEQSTTTAASTTTAVSTTETTSVSTTESTTESTTAQDADGYTVKEETVYATTTVNVRKGPGTGYDKVGTLSLGSNITRIATGSNGWSKVIFNGETCYIASEYLSLEKPEETTDEAAQASSNRIVVDPNQELWNLVVVNMSREMPDNYVPTLAEVADTGVYMDYRVAPHYTEMYYAAKEDGITLTPYSGYRSYDRQKNNYNNLTETYMTRYGISREEAAKKAATVILPPGTSEHNLGLAMDICNTLDSFATQKEYAWLTEHAHEYGFILRYTAEKMSVTGIVSEPWHWRYVGVEYAEKIKNSGLCLEEYLDSVGIAY